MFSTSVFADCYARLYVDPSFSNQITKTVESTLRAKKYKIVASGLKVDKTVTLSFGDEEE